MVELMSICTTVDLTPLFIIVHSLEPANKCCIFLAVRFDETSSHKGGGRVSWKWRALKDRLRATRAPRIYTKATARASGDMRGKKR
jgi:hypothetical protein